MGEGSAWLGRRFTPQMQDRPGLGPAGAEAGRHLQLSSGRVTTDQTFHFPVHATVREGR